MSDKPTVAGLLARPELWGQCGNKNNSENSNCIQTAISRVYGYGDETEEAIRKFCECVGIPKNDGVYMFKDIWDWNDAPERTHAEVLEAVRKAGI